MSWVGKKVGPSTRELETSGGQGIAAAAATRPLAPYTPNTTCATSSPHPLLCDIHCCSRHVLRISHRESAATFTTPSSCGGIAAAIPRQHGFHDRHSARPYGAAHTLGLETAADMAQSFSTLSSKPPAATYEQALPHAYSADPRLQWKILILDEDTQKLINNVVKEDDILNLNITSTRLPLPW